MSPTLKLNREIVEMIKESFKFAGQLQPILVCKQHPERILSGKHRAAAGGKDKQEIDIDALCKRNAVTHKIAEKTMELIGGFQRKVSAEERQEQFDELCREFEVEGVPKGEIAARVVALGFRKSTAYDYIRNEYKEKEKVNAGRLGSETRNDERNIHAPPNISVPTSEQKKEVDNGSKEIKQELIRGKDEELLAKAEQPKRSPYNQPTGSQTAKKLYTETEQSFVGFLNGMDFDFNPGFPREGETNSRGEQKGYWTDCYSPSRNLVIELMGDGSASDNPKRDKFLAEKKMKVWKSPNDFALKHGHTIRTILLMTALERAYLLELLLALSKK